MNDSDIESVEHVSLGVLRDLWEMRWGESYVAMPTSDKFWFRVAERLYESGWCGRVKTHPERYIYRLKEAVK